MMCFEAKFSGLKWGNIFFVMAGTKKIARLKTVRKGRNFLTRIWKLVSGRKSYFASLNWS